MRAIITNPMYRALKTTAERKAAFQAFIDREAKRERVFEQLIEESIMLYSLTLDKRKYAKKRSQSNG